MGSLEARGVAEGDRTSFWQVVIVDLFSGGSAWRDSSCGAASLQVGLDTRGTRGDFQGRYGPSIGPIDRQIAWPLPLDGEPGNEPQWRLGFGHDASPALGGSATLSVTGRCRYEGR